MIHKWLRKDNFYTNTLLCATLAVAACSGDQDNSTGSSDFKVALLTPGPISDQSWNGGAYEGLMWIRDSLRAKVSHIQTRTPAEFDENFRQYGAQGYDLVFGHGFEFQDAALRAGPQFPRTIYITTSGTSTAKNVAGIEFAFEEASYLAGMIAGAMTKTGTIGMIGGTELPPVRRSFAAFALGVRSMNRKANTLTSYIGNWDDVSAGKEQALAQISRNADIIFQNADAAGLGVFQAARETKDVRVIGSNSDQNNIAPEVTLGSVVIDLPRAFLTVAREVKDGKFTPRVISLGLHDNIVKLVINPRLESTIPPGVRHQVDSARNALDGRLESASARQ
ncbi:MAG: BMP family protein [Gemmatimonadota bacterium]|nr:BMP family protein [Gemmatimonadota bacterium]